MLVELMYVREHQFIEKFQKIRSEEEELKETGEYLSRVREVAEHLQQVMVKELEEDKRKYNDYIAFRQQTETEEIKKRLEETWVSRGRGGSRRKYLWSTDMRQLFGETYAWLYGIWKEVKKMAKAEQSAKERTRREHWRETVKEAYHAFDLPNDLIELLSDMDPYISSSSNIALEHAARVCGVKPNEYNLRHLRTFLPERT